VCPVHCGDSDQVAFGMVPIYCGKIWGGFDCWNVECERLDVVVRLSHLIHTADTDLVTES
jgi:hypothetical protein